MRPRLDAADKVAGRTRYVADLELPGMAYATLVRADLPHARVLAIDSASAAAVAGVLGVFTAADVTSRLHGRAVEDVPLLARDTVRFVGEPVAVVVAESRRAAEHAARRVVVTLEELPFVTDVDSALRPDAPTVHTRPWSYANAVTCPDWHPNLQSHTTTGSAEAAIAALARCSTGVDLTFETPSGHQGYLEPQACIAAVEDGRVRVWITNKSPYSLRRQLAGALELDESTVQIEPVPIGGDFGGKGSPQHAPLCVELSRLLGRPVKLVLRFAEELTATNPRHPSTTRIRLGCDAEGTLLAAHLDVRLNGGAYAGYKPRRTVDLGGIATALEPYRIDDAFLETRIVYSHTVPRGHMRSPGHPQASFAVESAIDELARCADVDPLEMRRRSLLGPGSAAFTGGSWPTGVATEVLRTAGRLAPTPTTTADPHWRYGRGVAMCIRRSPAKLETSVRVQRTAYGGIRLELPVPETGTGSHTAARSMLADAIGVPEDDIEVVHVSTDDLPIDAGVGHSRVTMGLASAMRIVGEHWPRHVGDGPLLVQVAESSPADDPPPACYCAQVADVAVDVETGQIRVLAITTVVEVGRIVNPPAHQLQIEGGTVMGLGFALLEDLAESAGRIRAGNLGDFRLPTAADVPRLTTVHVRVGDDADVVKPIGELANVAVVPAIANAVRDATGQRLTRLPLDAEALHSLLRGGPTPWR